MVTKRRFTLGTPSKARTDMLSRFRPSRWLSIGRRVTLAFVVASLVPVVTFAFVSLTSAETALRSRAREDLLGRVDGFRKVLDSHGRAVLDQVVANGEEDECCAAMDRRDAAWLADNVTVWVVKNSAMSGAQARTLDDRVLSAAGDLRYACMSDAPVVIAAKEERTCGVDLQVIEGRLFIIGAGPIVDETAASPSSHGVIVYGELVNDTILAEAASIVGVERLDVYVGGHLVGSSAGAERLGSSAKLYPGLHESDRRITYVCSLHGRAEQTGAMLVVTMDRRASTAASQALRSATMFAGCVALIIAVTAGIAVRRAQRQPLQRLADAAMAIAQGARCQRVPIESDDEFGAAAVAFNQMSEQLDDAFAELRRRSETDSLTGLLNHRATHRALAVELKRCRRYGRYFSLLAMDIDGFKLLNDAHGHPTGDKILRMVADLLRNETRESDVVGRLGGDEFLIVLPEAAPSQASVLADRLRDALRRSPFSVSDEERIPIRVSIGIASYPEDGSRPGELIGSADQRLYVSKRRGGDAVTGAEDRDDEQVESSAVFDMLDSMVTAIDNKDCYTRRHSEQVTAYALAIAECLELPEEMREVLRISGMLHDVGKIGVPDRILRRPGRLTEAEFEIVKGHTLLGETIVAALPGGKEIRAAVVSHHERYDGGGYPCGLAGDEIPLLGRILAVADAYSAMTSNRPYRTALSRNEALLELRACSGTQFDPEIVEAALGCLDALAEEEETESPERVS